jgi:hypothetical protein
MGIRNAAAIVLTLALSHLVENVSAVAINSRPSIQLSSAGPVIKRADGSPGPVGLSAVPRSALGLSTEDPSLKTEETWYWGVDSKRPANFLNKNK